MFKITKPIFYWALYDFANSLVIINFSLYLSQWLIIENKLPDIWFSFSIAITTIVLFVTAPIAGRWCDATGGKISLIKKITFVMAFFTILISIFGNSNLSNQSRVLLVLIFMTIAQYAYQLSLVIYDTLLADLSASKHYGYVSGFGEAMGNLGLVVGLIVTYPLVQGMLNISILSGRLAPFLPIGIIFAILSLPMIKTLRDIKTAENPIDNRTLKDLIVSFKDILKDKNIFYFLIGFYFISDAILTVQTFFPIYLNEVLGFTDYQKIITTIATLLSIVAGSIILGGVSDKFGFKKSASLIIYILIIVLSIFPLLRRQFEILVIISMSGFLWGGFAATCRALLTKLAPKNKRGEFFSLYTIFRRSASILGPLLWSLNTSLLTNLGPNKYRVAVYSLVVFIILGLVFFRKIKEVTQI